MKLQVKLLKVMALLMLLLPVMAKAQQDKGSVKGTIEAEDGTPLAGATLLVKENRQQQVADEGGRFVLSNLPLGKVTVEVSYAGYETQSKTVEVNAEQATLTIRLKPVANTLGNIVVSTQKRSQALLEVPITITAVDNQFLRRLNITEFDQLSAYVPGLEMQLQSPNNPGFVIRGITSDDGDSRVQPRVSVFQDGVSISRARGAVVELFDMERVEVVKGPQGTLFGRSAQIGAVHLIQNKPRNYTTGEVNAWYGNYNQLNLTGVFNTPIVKDKLLMRIAAIQNQRDGFVGNLSGDKALNSKKTTAVRGSFRWLPSAGTTLDLIINYQVDKPTGTSFRSKAYAPKNGSINPWDDADLEQGDTLGVDRKVYGATLLWNQKLNNSWSLTSITNARRFDSYEAFDADGTAAPALQFAEDAVGDQFSQEFRLNYAGKKKFNGFGGLSYFYENGNQVVPFITNEQSLYTLFTPVVRNGIINNPSLPDAVKQQLLQAIPFVPLTTNGVPNYVTNIPNIPPVFGAIAGAPLATRHFEQYTNFGKTGAFEIFADGTYAITEKLKLTAGLRGTYEKLTAGFDVPAGSKPSPLGGLLGNFPNILFRATGGKMEVSEDYWSWVGRLALNYQFANQNLYASVSRGRRPGVINISKIDTILLKPEIVWSYEVGIKGLLANKKLQYDLAAYYYDWDNFQTNVANINNPRLIEVSDAGRARSFGIETGIRYAPSSKVSFFTTYGFIDAAFKDKDEDGRPQQLAGNTFRLTPKHSFSIGGEYAPQLGKNLQGYIRPSYTYKSKVYFEDTNTELLSQSGYGLLNLNTGIRITNGSKTYEIGFFGRNLLNEEFIIDAGNTGNAFGIPTFIAGQPLMAGGQIRIIF